MKSTILQIQTKSGNIDFDLAIFSGYVLKKEEKGFLSLSIVDNTGLITTFKDLHLIEALKITAYITDYLVLTHSKNVNNN